MNNEKVFEHHIKIDDNTDVRLKIPEVIDAVEFTSILEKARKILKISEIQVFPQSSNKKVDVDEEKLLQEYKSTGFGNRQQLVAKYGFRNYQALQSKIYAIRKKLGQSAYAGNGRKKKYSDEFVSDIVKRIKSGDSVPDIANDINISTKVVYALITKRIGKSVKEIKIEKFNGSKKVKKGSIWTQERTERLMKLYHSGVSSKDISKEMMIKPKKVYDKVYTLKVKGTIK